MTSDLVYKEIVRLLKEINHDDQKRVESDATVHQVDASGHGTTRKPSRINGRITIKAKARGD